MSRPTCLLLIVAQVLAVLARSGLLICVHDDGRVLLESTLSACAEDAADRNHSDAGVGDHSGEAASGAAIPCRDYAFGSGCVLSRQDKKPEPKAAAEAQAPDSTTPAPHQTFAATRIPAPRTRAPSPPASLAHISCIVLRC